ncbi:MAG: CHAT domain-containing protein [Bacteroidetes bacterium]|jgi:CHAT domain-containing protein/Tfp pilus assembly protein PilF|nr:CHAT domain-containing protein [Bacteroidota bacterium]
MVTLLKKAGIALLILQLVLSAPLLGQSSDQLQQSIDEAETAVNEGSFGKAKQILNEAEKESCGTANRTNICYDAKFLLAAIERMEGSFEVAIELLDDLEAYVQQTFPKDAFKLIKVYRERLLVELNDVDLEEASIWSDRILEAANAPGVEGKAAATAYLAVADYEDAAGNYRKAIEFYKRSIRAAKETNNPGDVEVLLINAHNNLGIAYRGAGELDKAMEQYQMNLELAQNVHGEEHIEVASAYNNIGTIFYLKQDIGQAAEYFAKTAAIIEGIFGPDHQRLGASLNNAGLSYYAMEEYEKAAEFLERAQRVKEANLGMNHPETAIGYTNLASIYIQNGDYEAAEQNYLRSISVRENSYGKNHPDLVKTKIELGKLYLNHLNSTEKARKSFESALAISLDRLRETHPVVADVYLLIGNTNYKEKRFKEALSKYKDAMSLLYGDYSLDDEPDMDRPMSDPIKLVQVLQAKARVYTERTNGFEKESYHKAYRAMVWASEIVDVLQHSYKHEASKLRLVDQNYSIFTNAVEILAEFYKATDDDRYLAQMFEFIEKSRSRIALELLQDVSARSFAGVPTEIIEKEEALSSEISRLQKKVYNEQQKVENLDNGRILTLQDSVFAKKREHEEFINELEQDYPLYFELKYEKSVVSLQEAQSLLKGKETLVSYVIGTDRMYAFVVNPGSADVVDLGRPDDIIAHISGLRDHITNNNSENYLQSAHIIYERIVKPVEPHITGESVLIMADQSMHYLPFEVLLTHKATQAAFDKLPYLLKEYTISYVPSATLLKIMDERRPDNPRNLLAVAPFSNDIVRPDAEQSRVQYASTVEPLLLTKYETQSISDLFTEKRSWGEYMSPQRVKLLTGPEATVEEFKAVDVENYNYIHFATHAFVNEEEPKYSGIMMYPDADESGISYVSDIYAMNFNADLVVLGACETGLGSVYRGEGLIGFTRAFIYAGVSNLVVSMWKVNDQPTTYLMIDFYDYIRDGYGYSEALRQAKLNTLKKPNMSNPIHWAAFILTGR